jgi:hypothetical protein
MKKPTPIIIKKYTIEELNEFGQKVATGWHTYRGPEDCRVGDVVVERPTCTEPNEVFETIKDALAKDLKFRNKNNDCLVIILTNKGTFKKMMRN